MVNTRKIFMKKIWLAFAGICVILLSFCGCTNQSWSQQDWEEYTDDMGKWSSQLAGAFDSPVVACIDHTIAYPNGDHLCFYDTVEEKIVTSSPSSSEIEEFVGISAGKKYFYVLIDKRGPDELSDSLGQFYLRLYHPDASIYQEVPVPFKRMFVSDGIVYGYWDSDDYRLNGFERKTGHIEATHYLSEEKFLTDFSNKISDWNEMEGSTLQLGSKTFYAYPADNYMHNKMYYCDEKYLNKIQQFYFTEYVGGELVTPERMMDARYLKQMYSMMKKKEKNWVTYAWEVEGTLYGICNIYQNQPGFLAQMDTSCIDYSISFCYNENTDTFDKLDEYEDVELIYADGYCTLTHTVDSVYCKELVTGQEDKILDYDGAITVDVRDRLLYVARLGNELMGDSYMPVEQENYWGEGILLIKKLW